MRIVISLKSAKGTWDKTLRPHCPLRVRRGVPCGRGVPWRGVRYVSRRRSRAAQHLKIDGKWLWLVLSGCLDVFKLDLSFQTHKILPSNSSGRPSYGSESVSRWILDAFFDLFGRPLSEPYRPIDRTGTWKSVMLIFTFSFDFWDATKSAIFVFLECEWTGLVDFLVRFGCIFWGFGGPVDDR